MKMIKLFESFLHGNSEKEDRKKASSQKPQRISERSLDECSRRANHQNPAESFFGLSG